jgi:hypothetical protein
VILTNFRARQVADPTALRRSLRRGLLDSTRSGGSYSGAGDGGQSLEDLGAGGRKGISTLENVQRRGIRLDAAPGAEGAEPGSRRAQAANLAHLRARVIPTQEKFDPHVYLGTLHWVRERSSLPCKVPTLFLQSVCGAAKHPRGSCMRVHRVLCKIPRQCGCFGHDACKRAGRMHANNPTDTPPMLEQAAAHSLCARRTPNGRRAWRSSCCMRSPGGACALQRRQQPIVRLFACLNRRRAWRS